MDAIRELERILQTNEGELSNAIGPSRRVGPDHHVPYASLRGLSLTTLTTEPTPELSECAGSLSAFVDAERKITRTVSRTLWRARTNGAQNATIFHSTHRADRDGLEMSGVFGCDLVDVVVDSAQELIRATLRLKSPLPKGELSLTEWEAMIPSKGSAANELSVFVPRREAEIIVAAQFDATCIPGRVRVQIDYHGKILTRRLPLNGVNAVHAETNFGPGVISLRWDW